MKNGPFICRKMVVLVLGLMITRKFVRNNKKCSYYKYFVAQLHFSWVDFFIVIDIRNLLRHELDR